MVENSLPECKYYSDSDEAHHSSPSWIAEPTQPPLVPAEFSYDDDNGSFGNTGSETAPITVVEVTAVHVSFDDYHIYNNGSNNNNNNNSSSNGSCYSNNNSDPLASVISCACASQDQQRQESLGVGRVMVPVLTVSYDEDNYNGQPQSRSGEEDGTAEDNNNPENWWISRAMHEFCTNQWLTIGLGLGVIYCCAPSPRCRGAVGSIAPVAWVGQLMVLDKEQQEYVLERAVELVLLGYNTSVDFLVHRQQDIVHEHWDEILQTGQQVVGWVLEHYKLEARIVWAALYQALQQSNHSWMGLLRHTSS